MRRQWTFTRTLSSGVHSYYLYMCVCLYITYLNRSCVVHAKFHFFPVLVQIQVVRLMRVALLLVH